MTDLEIGGINTQADNTIVAEVRKIDLGAANVLAPNSLSARLAAIQSAVGGEGGNSHISLFPGDIYYVDAAQADNIGAGTSPETAKRTIGAAIGLLSAGDAISVKAGTYTETGLDLNVNRTKLWVELGTIIDPASGTGLTISGHYCSIECSNGALSVTPAAGQTGVLVSGNWAYISNVRVNCGSSANIGLDVTGNGGVLFDCRVADPLVAAFKVQGNKTALLNCCTGGSAGDSSIGFWITNSCDLARISDCCSRGHETAGYQVDTGCTAGMIANCSSGGGDGRWSDADDTFVWSNFTFDDEVFHTTTFAGGGPSSDNLFQVTGAVEIEYIYGDVETILSANVDNIYLDLWDGTNSVEITDNGGGGTDTVSADVGSVFAKTEVATQLITLMKSDQCRVEENTNFRRPRAAFFVTQKKDTNTYIRVVYSGVATSGVIHWHCRYSPLTEIGFVTAV